MPTRDTEVLGKEERQARELRGYIQAAAANNEAAGTSKMQRAAAREPAEVATRTVRSRSWRPVLIEVNSRGELMSMQLDTPQGTVHVPAADVATKWQRTQLVIPQAAAPAVAVHVTATTAVTGTHTRASRQCTVAQRPPQLVPQLVPQRL